MGPDRFPLTIEIAESADTDDDYYTVVPFAGEWRLVEAWFVPDTTTAADASDYVGLTIEGNDGTTDLGTIDTSSDPLTAGTAREIALDDNAQVEIYTGQTDEIKVSVGNTGTTGAAIAGRLVLGFERGPEGL